MEKQRLFHGQTVNKLKAQAIIIINKSLLQLNNFYNPVCTPRYENADG
jgi:hypothetical protein